MGVGGESLRALLGAGGSPRRDASWGGGGGGERPYLPEGTLPPGGGGTGGPRGGRGAPSPPPRVPLRPAREDPGTGDGSGDGLSASEPGGGSGAPRAPMPRCSVLSCFSRSLRRFPDFFFFLALGGMKGIAILPVPGAALRLGSAKAPGLGVRGPLERPPPPYSP